MILICISHSGLNLSWICSGLMSAFQIFSEGSSQKIHWCVPFKIYKYTHACILITHTHIQGIYAYMHIFTETHIYNYTYKHMHIPVIPTNILRLHSQTKIHRCRYTYMRPQHQLNKWWPDVSQKQTEWINVSHITR